MLATAIVSADVTTAEPLPGGVRASLKLCEDAGSGFSSMLTSFACSVVLTAPSATIFERADAHFGRASAQWALGNSEPALADLVEAIRLDPRDARFFELRGDILKAGGDVDGALAAYDAAVVLEPVQPQARMARVDILMEKSRYLDAIADFDVILKTTEEPGVYHTNRGLARLRLIDEFGPLVDPAEYDRAMADFDKALPLMDDDQRSSVYFNRAELQVMRSLWAKAIPDYDEALRLRPDDVSYLLKRAIARKGAGDISGARADLDAAARLPPLDPWTTRVREERFAISTPEERDRLLKATRLTLMDARADFDQNTGEPIVSIVLDDASRKIFFALTTDHIGETLELLVDGEVLSDTVVREPIEGGKVQIAGGFTAEDVQALATKLRSPGGAITVRLQSPPLVP